MLAAAAQQQRALGGKEKSGQGLAVKQSTWPVMLIRIELMDIKELHAEGNSIREIVRKTGHSRNTVRKVLRNEHTLQQRKGPVRKPHPSKLDAFKDYVKERYEEFGLSAVRLMGEIQPMGYSGSIATLRRYLQTLKPAIKQEQKLTVRYETAPGKQAQVDWAYCGRFPDPLGKLIGVYAFVMVLGFSRMLFVRFTTSMGLPQLLECHQKGFEYFGGWTQTILYDNMKQVKLSRDRWNELFVDFCNHYGIVPKTHRPYRPKTKGKVERAVDYLKNNFLVGRSFEGINDLNAQVMHWLQTTANIRIHGTTGKQPVDLFEDEKQLLIPVHSVSPYNWVAPVERKVDAESMVRFDRSRYSVPPKYSGHKVAVHSQGGNIIIQAADTIIAEHKQALRAGQCVTDKEHLTELWKLTQEQTPLPQGHLPWQVSFEQNVQQASLAQFEEVAL